MPRVGAFLRILSILSVAALLLTPTAVAQGQSDKDLAQIRAYRLSEAALAKYTQAVQAFTASGAPMPTSEGDDGAQGKSLTQQVAALDAVPEAKKAIADAGLTTREFVVLTWSLFDTGMADWALTQPGGKLPAGVSMENVDFYRKHDTELQALKAVMDGDREEEEEEMEGD